MPVSQKSAWAHIQHSGINQPPKVLDSSHITKVIQLQPGEYLVTFPVKVKHLTCIATINNVTISNYSANITATPGDLLGLSLYQVHVYVSEEGVATNDYDFSLSVFYLG